MVCAQMLVNANSSSDATGCKAAQMQSHSKTDITETEPQVVFGISSEMYSKRAHQCFLEEQQRMRGSCQD